MEIRPRMSEQEHTEQWRKLKLFASNVRYEVHLSRFVLFSVRVTRNQLSSLLVIL